jgi:hypothetical protein
MASAEITPEEIVAGNEPSLDAFTRKQQDEGEIQNIKHQEGS